MTVRPITICDNGNCARRTEAKAARPPGRPCATLPTSCAPCERCLCAIASMDVENVVFGVSYEAFSKLTPGDAIPPDRESLLRKLGIQMKLAGPVLEDDGYGEDACMKAADD